MFRSRKALKITQGYGKIKWQVSKNFENWLAAYTTYMWVTFQVEPERGPFLIKYLNLLHRVYWEYTGFGWLIYDELFHTMASMGSLLPWEKGHTQLWSQCMGTAVVFTGHYGTGNHSVERALIGSWWGLKAKQWVQPHLHCWYNFRQVQQETLQV